MVYDIAVIGAGATAVSLLLALREEARAAGIPAVSIALWGKPDSFGTGEAFGAARAEYCVNTHAAMLGLTESDPSGFLRWLANRDRADDAYPERAAMAQFLQSSYVTLRGSSELIVAEIRDEVIDVCARSSGGFRVIGGGGASVASRCVVLCLGAAPRRSFAALTSLPGYRGSNDTTGSFEGASVLIAGTGPSALDVFRSAMVDGAREIHMFSRNGYPPTCQNLAPNYQPRHFTWPVLQELYRGRSLRLSRAIGQFQKEVREMGRRCEFQPAMMALKNRDIHAFLAQLLHRAQAQDLPLQDLLMSTRPYMHWLWRGLPPNDQLLFVRRWRALWSAWRHPVPVKVYEQLYDAVRAGVLYIHRIAQPPVHRDGQFFVQTADHRMICGAIFVDATGWNACADSTALLRALRQRGMIEMHPCGGIQMDPARMQCMVQSRLIRDLYAIGPLARGALFSTNAHWFNAKCAAHWARQWVAEAAAAAGIKVVPGR